jgi:adenine-specific DNA-methyltransferase
MNNYDKLCNVLKTNPALVTAEGELLKNKVQELARKMDASLLATLLSDEFTAEMFFTDVNGFKVFDANKFTYMVESQAFLPDSYTRFKQNIMLTDGVQSIRKSGDVVLEFPNKDCVLEFDSTDTDTAREEVFLNETLMRREIDTLLDHKAFQNATRYDINGASPATTVSMDDNLIIKGNNLLALHTLYPKYKSAIKLMYWDILYNTQSDQVPYNDCFKHSSWLTMMKNRLEIAQKLLKDDGVICMQCDDNEQAYLTVLCDEVFGRENRLNTLVVEMASTGGLKRSHKDKRFLKTKEYILIYSKTTQLTLNCLYNPVNFFDSHFNIWFDGTRLDSVTNIIKENFPDNKLAQKFWLEDSKIKDFLIKNAHNIFQYHPAPSWTLEVGHKKEVVYSDATTEVYKFTHKNNPDNIEFCKTVNNKTKFGRMEPLIWNVETLYSGKEITTLRGDLWKDFYKDMGNVKKEGSANLTNGKKPERLISDIIAAFTVKGDIVLDAYLGSGTTAAVAHKMNRKYIGIEQLDDHSKMEIDRMQSVIAGDKTGISNAFNWNGGGSFVFFELAKNSQVLIDKIVASSEASELATIYDELKTSPFVLYNVDILKMEQNKDGFASLTIEEQKKFLVSIIDKNTLYINYSDIDNGNHSLTEQDKEFTRNFYKED